jgi:hypothetical protein
MIFKDSNEIVINTNIFETNIVNLLILFGLLIYIGKNFLKNAVNKRKDQILQTLEILQNNFKKATFTFIHSQKQFKQVKFTLYYLRDDNTIQKITALNRKYQKFNKARTLLFLFGMENILKNKLNISIDLQRFFLSFAIGKVLKRCTKFSNREKEQILSRYILKFPK